MTRTTRILFVLLFFLICAAPLLSQEDAFYHHFEDRLADELQRFQERHKLTSLSFSMFQGENYSFGFASGYADYRHKVTATTDHIYTLASVTKPITGIVTMELVKRNVLALDDSVYKYIDSFPKDVTVSDLLNHTSGFVREKENKRYLSDSDYRNVVQYLPRKYKCKIHRYANVNYAALGALIEKATRNPYSIVARYYFKKATGENLYFYNHGPRESTLFAKNYVRSRHRQFLHRPVDFGLWEPAAFAQTSSQALAKFFRHYMTPDFIEYLEAHSVVIRNRKYANGKSKKDCYALGFRLRYVDGELKYIYHNGFLYGVLSSFYYFPTRDVGFVALSNMSYYPHQRVPFGVIYKKVENILDEEYNRVIADHTVNKGFVEGVIFYESNRQNGQLSEHLISDYAQEYLKEKKFKEAIDLFKLNVYAFPDSKRTYQDLATAYRKNGSPGRMADFLKSQDVKFMFHGFENSLNQMSVQ